MPRGPYKARAWDPLRRMVLERDGYRCQIRGKRCLGAANEVDHIVPLVAGGAMFDPANLRAACKPCNAGRVSAERADNGWKRSATRITLVHGPPGAGKSTYVRDHADPGDVIVDFDVIAASLGSEDTHDHSQALVDATNAARNAVLRKLRRGELKAAKVWLVSANRDAVAKFPHHYAVLVDPGIDEVRRRAVAAGRPARWLDLIEQWYATPVAAPGGRRSW